MSGQAIEASAPESAVELEPVLRARQCLGPQPATPVLANPLIRNERSLFQHLEVPRDRGERDVEGFCKLPDRRLAAREPSQDRAARGIRERTESMVELHHITEVLFKQIVKSSLLRSGPEQALRCDGGP